ncbi:cation channel sperm-associated protein 4-like [Protopterus annectens]|uniref:cation channel sperm-associated protein 4-like n=1 Tax=Protopterus annectens TaxID=7888 RepID=UPI001CFBA655|nr:cation channel sperm-associated protein 4-like [Protopterus annectens]
MDEDGAIVAKEACSTIPLMQNDWSQAPHVCQVTTENRPSLIGEEMDFSAITVKKDNVKAPDYMFHNSIGRFIESKYCQAAHILLISTSIVVMACETSHEIEVNYSHILCMIDSFIFTMFLCDILLKLYYGVWMFWRDVPSIMDLGIVVGLNLHPVLDFGKSVHFLKVLKLVLTIRNLSVFKGLCLIVDVILISLPEMTSIIVLLVTLMMLFSAFGVAVFGVYVSDYFGSIGKSMFSLFICITQDGWADIYSSFRAIGGTVMYGGGAYLFSFVTIGGFVCSNLLVAVISNNLEQVVIKAEYTQSTSTDVNMTDKASLKDHSMPGEGNSYREGVKKEESFEDLQKIFKCCTVEDLSLSKINEFYIVVELIHKNYTEYKMLRKELDSIVEEVRQIPFNQEHDYEELIQLKLKLLCGWEADGN